MVHGIINIDKEIDQIMEKIMKQLDEKIGAFIRK